MPVGGHKVIAFSTLLVRRLILLRWRDAAPPTVTHWIRDVLSNLKLEKNQMCNEGLGKEILPDLEIFSLINPVKE